MSHSSGTVKFKNDNKEFWFEYNGTVDICISSIYETKEKMDEHWRKYEHKTCTCGNDEEVIIESHYGGGFSWNGRACRHCMCITQGLNPDDQNDDEYNRYIRGWEFGNCQ